MDSNARRNSDGDDSSTSSSVSSSSNVPSVFPIIFCVIGIILGLSACLLFFFRFHLAETAAWAFMSALFAAVSLHLHVLYRRFEIMLWHNQQTIEGIRTLGVVVVLFASAFFIWYLFEGLYYHKDPDSMTDNPYLTSVWAFMTAKWGLVIILICRKSAELIFHGADLESS